MYLPILNIFILIVNRYIYPIVNSYSPYFTHPPLFLPFYKFTIYRKNDSQHKSCCEIKRISQKPIPKIYFYVPNLKKHFPYFRYFHSIF